MSNLKYLLITPGDPGGIGPEVTWKALQRVRLPANFRILVVGGFAGFDKIGAPYTRVSDSTNITSFLSSLPKYRPGDPVTMIGVRIPPKMEAKFNGSVEKKAGFESGWSVSYAVRLLMEKLGSANAAIVTGPICKKRLMMGGFPFPGHTDFLSYLSKGYSRGKKAVSKTKSVSIPPVTMLLANELFKVSLVTTHIPLSQVPKAITKERILRAALHTLEFVKRHSPVSVPKIGILGLNPHAGESGLLGTEEKKIIIPTITALNKRVGANVFSGPFPADTYFAVQASFPKSKRHGAVIAMYHDQGLIPAKLVNFDKTVNITLGLPFLRTSVDHGTAFDIAGKNIASPDSMVSAIELAARFLSNDLVF